MYRDITGPLCWQCQPGKCSKYTFQYIYKFHEEQWRKLPGVRRLRDSLQVPLATLGPTYSIHTAYTLTHTVTFGLRMGLQKSEATGDCLYSDRSCRHTSMWQKSLAQCSRDQLKCDGTWWCTGGEVKGKLANGVGSQYSSHYLGTWCIQQYYRWWAHLGCQ
jgi:hypothetical protein